MTISEATKNSEDTSTNGNDGDSSSKRPPLCSSFARKEKSRYERKGFGLAFAAAIALGFFLGVPELGKWVWPKVLAW